MINKQEIKNTEQWVHQYLNGDGNNKDLSIGLLKKKRYWLGPLDIPLSKLHRCCGYEKHMEYKESKILWDKKISIMSKKIKNGWDAPPLIATYSDGKLSLRDGNHRYAALKKCNKKSYLTIIWYDTKKDIGKGL